MSFEYDVALTDLCRPKFFPLRLYVDQDAVDFLKKFFSFKDPNSTHTSDESLNEGEAFIRKPSSLYYEREITEFVIQKWAKYSLLI